MFKSFAIASAVVLAISTSTFAQPPQSKSAVLPGPSLPSGQQVGQSFTELRPVVRSTARLSNYLIFVGFDRCGRPVYRSSSQRWQRVPALPKLSPRGTVRPSAPLKKFEINEPDVWDQIEADFDDPFEPS